MTASENLGRQFMYHYSPPKHRESINTKGLRARNPGDEVGPRGVYVVPKRQPWMGNDVWRVDTKGLDLHEDPWPGGVEAYYTPNHVGRERIRLADRMKEDRTGDWV